MPQLSVDLSVINDGSKTTVSWTSEQAYPVDHPYAAYLRLPITQLIADCVYLKDTLTPVGGFLRYLNGMLSGNEELCLTLASLEYALGLYGLITENLGSANYSFTEGFAFKSNEAFVTITRTGDSYYVIFSRLENIGAWV